MKRKFWWPILLLVVLIFGGWLIVSQSLRDNASQQYEKTKVPTLFLHGYGSSHRAEEHMTQAIVKAGVTQNVIRATVSKDGTVKLQGHYLKVHIIRSSKWNLKITKTPIIGKMVSGSKMFWSNSKNVWL